MMRCFVSRLRRDRRGATLLEFALVSPVMLLAMMGLGDLLYQEYAQSILNGAIQKAARDSSIEGGANNTAAIDGKVITLMTPIMKNLVNSCPPSGAAATWCATRKTYDSFSEVAPEPFTDSNGNGVRDTGECYTDENGNGSWDADPGLDGQGGASAVTLYTMTISYPRIFPVAGLFKWAKTQTITSTTLLKNQPYASQTTTTNVTICK
jgi:Flp pilus assembly protein TadG